MAQNKRFNFTKAAIEAVPATQRRERYYDTRVRGLMLAVSPKGLKVFYLYRKVAGSPQEIKLGVFPDMTIEQARLKVQEENVAIAKGENPQAEKRQKREEMTLQQLFEWHAAHHPMAKKKKTLDQDKGVFNRYLRHLAGRKLSQISRTDLRKLQANLAHHPGTCTANKVLTLVRCLYNRAIDYELFKGINPGLGIDNFAEEKRDRRLMPSEIPRFLDAVNEHPNEDIRDFVLLSLYTGARRGNLSAMRWDQIELMGKPQWRIPETKNGLPQVVPLEEAELEILRRRRQTAQGPWVFPGSGKSGHLEDPKAGWKRILERAGIEDFRLHDLRRTLGSWMADTGATLHVVGKALNHQNPSTTAIYARISVDPVRQAKAKAHEALLKAAMDGPAP